MLLLHFFSILTAIDFAKNHETLHIKWKNSYLQHRITDSFPWRLKWQIKIRGYTLFFCVAEVILLIFFKQYWTIASILNQYVLRS